MPNSRHSAAIFSPSSSRATNFSRSSVGSHTFRGILRPPQKAPLCYPCLQNELSPFFQEGQCPALTHPPRPAIVPHGGPFAHIRCAGGGRRQCGAVRGARGGPLVRVRARLRRGVEILSRPQAAPPPH